MNKTKILINNLKALKNVWLKKTYLDNMPSYFWIEPTNHCNLKCIMCPNGTGEINIEKGYMEFDLYKNIIDQIKDYASAVTLAVNGESLLHSDFIKMVKYTKEKKIKVILNTNAVLLNKEMSKLILEAEIDNISFAFDGFNKSMYEKARVGANYEKTLENIFYFLSLKKKMKKTKPYTVLSILMLGLEDINNNEKQKFLDQFTGLIDTVRLREVSTWGNIFKKAKNFSFRENKKAYLPCSRLWSTSVIAWNGDVLPCIYNANHEYVLGNIKEKPFKEIWNNNKILALRNAMLNTSYLKLSPLCEHCIVLGTKPILKIPSGIRLSLADAITNFLGYKAEKFLLVIANHLSNKKFSSKTIK